MENGGGLTELPAKMDAFLNATSRCPFCAENFESIGDVGARRNLLELHALVHHPLAYTTLAHHIDRLDLLDAAAAYPAKAKFLVPEKIAEYRGSGGVRIEDDVLITASGNENFSILPRSVEEIEAFMAKNNPLCKA